MAPQARPDAGSDWIQAEGIDWRIRAIQNRAMSMYVTDPGLYYTIQTILSDAWKRLQAVESPLGNPSGNCPDRWCEEDGWCVPPPCNKEA